MIVNIPIEPIEERYSAQWNKWFNKEFFDEVPFTTIEGCSTSGRINLGSFLDVIETNKYKISQLQQILEWLEDYSTHYRDETVVLFFHDLWWPGLETIAYIKDGLGLDNLKICGCLHAGTYDPYDFLSKKHMEHWADKMERAWFAEITDLIFVATRFHKDLLCTKRNIPRKNVVVTGFPIYDDFLPTGPTIKEKMIAFPHRLDSEKQPELFYKMAKRLGKKYPDWRFVVTKEEASSKKEYYQVLKQAKIAVSFAKQETWGIAMQEAVIANAFPVCPDTLSYHEMYHSRFLYKENDFEDACELVESFISNVDRKKDYAILETQKRYFLNEGSVAIPRMISTIKETFNGNI